MARSAVVYVVEIRDDRGDVRVLARAATSASTAEFTSADALWFFLVNGSIARNATAHQQMP